MVQASFPALEALIAFAAGVGLGLACFTLLERNLALYLDGRPVAGAVLQAGRLLLVAAGMLGAVQFGAIPLLSCALGLLAGRHVVLRRVRKAG